MLPSLSLPPAAHPSSTVPKSAPAKAPECFTEFFQEDKEESTPTTEKQEAGPIKMVSPPPSDNDDITTEEEQERDRVELLEVTAVSEEDNNRELLDAIEEIEPESEKIWTPVFHLQMKKSLPEIYTLTPEKVSLSTLE